MNRILLTGVTVAASFLSLTGCKESSDKAAPATAAVAAGAPSRPGEVKFPPNSPQLKQIKVEPVVTAEVPSNVIVAPGKIEVNPSRIAHVVMPLAGRIVSLVVKLGDAIRQGDAIMTVESPDADAAVSTCLQAQAAIAQAKSAVLKAQADLDRVRDLREHKAVAEKEVLNAQNALDQARATLDQNEATSKQALRRLEILDLKPGVFGQKLTVRAPLAGKVLEINAVPGEFRNDTSSAVVTVADLNTVWVSSDVPESEIRFIHPGERIDIELSAYPNETFHGRVTRIADAVDPDTRTIKVRAELDNSSGRLRPEMFGRIRHVESLERMPVVPQGAVIQGDTRNTVYKETGPGTFVPVPVGLGNKTGDRIAITDGLREGDRVVTDGAMLLRNN